MYEEIRKEKERKTAEIQEVRERRLLPDISGCGGMADAQDSKSCVGDYVWVQVPSSAVIDLYSTGLQ